MLLQKILTTFAAGMLTILSFSQQMNEQNFDSVNLIAKGAKLTLVSNQFAFTEGPAADKEGNIFFTDQPNNKIWKYDISGKLSVFMDNAGRSNGMDFDNKGRLISCADENNELWAIYTNRKIKEKVLLTDFNGTKLNGPNDVWVHKSGGMYFTDPYYQRDWWKRQSPDMKGEYVFYLPPGKSQPIIVDSTLKQPNGITGKKDGSTLFVADIRDNKTYQYGIKKDGSLSDRQLFTAQGSDGMTIDEQGNIYLTGNGVTIYDPSGNKIKNIAVPSKWTANVCFGGKNHTTLFITASESVYTLEMTVKTGE